MQATALTTIPSFQVIFFGKNHKALRIKIKIFRT